MAFTLLASIISILSFSSSMAAAVQASNPTLPQTYIVHVNIKDSSDATTHYHSFLPETAAASLSPRIIHSYHHVATGFAARLTQSQAEEMEKKEGFVSARPENTYTLHTTHVPNFLGLYRNVGAWPESNYRSRLSS